MVPQFGSVVVRLAGYQGGSILVPTLARVSAFFSSRLMVEEYISIAISVLFYIKICVMVRGHWGDQDLDGRIILRWIFRKLERVVETGWSWLRIGTGGGHLWVR